MLEYVRERGGDVNALLTEFELPAAALAERLVEMPLSSFHRFTESAARAIGDPFFGVHMAQKLAHGRFGVAEFVVRTAPTIRDALDRFVQFAPLAYGAVPVFSVETFMGAHCVRYRVLGHPTCLGRHANELIGCYLAQQARLVTKADFELERCWFAHDEPSDTSELRSALRCESIEFGAETNAIAIPESILDLPLATADPELSRLVTEQAQRQLEDVAPSIVARVRGAIRAKLSARVGSAPRIGELARGLGMGARTLQRRIQDDGATFQALVESVREDLARTYCADPRFSVAEVAYRLGYAQPSHFVRAFKRWTGATPTEFSSRRRSKGMGPGRR